MRELTIALQDMAEEILDQFQAQVETAILSQWQMAVSGHGVNGVGVNDKRYQKELDDPTSVITRMNTPGERVSVFRGGPVAARYETGVPPWDMKPSLIFGHHAKMGKHGAYNTVPFRHGSPRNAGQETGHFQVMRKDIYAVVSKRYVGGDEPFETSKPHIATQSSFTRRVKSKTGGGFRGTTTEVMVGPTGDLTRQVKGRGHRLALTGRAADIERRTKVIDRGRKGVQLPQGFQTIKYTWRASKYQGMQKMRQEYSHATQHHYTTFRRVSENSDPQSWWHPGFPVVPIIDNLVLYAEDVLPLLWEQFNEQLNE